MTPEQVERVEAASKGLYTFFYNDPLNGIQKYLEKPHRYLNKTSRDWWYDVALQCQVGIKWTDDDLRDICNKW